ncbi:TIGR02679 family protein [Alicyclobacillus cycloheptanicus]|uniref:Uncharacterized protein (TIGR02679 family) n=1 Tax=Alicyclobacillus cycloheptanicus TaxID=1457 RepID=A0ABT9XJB0_9BACL|nr:TIGR02679 family protein [Alicyclobacillus cycloheptanicus]MDQ0189873.1 uncharacterized protein (TIGR02679 family) [Alicyclobacillus cycloheptanicus]WDM02446.1 TIGR02679 family protein [Alicyclobacillus cycloheptanicus]
MDELTTYLRQPGFERLWCAAADKYRRQGRVGGRVQLMGLSDEEMDALSGLLAVNLVGRTEVAIRLTKVDEALRNSRFRVGLEEVLGRLFPGLRTREEQLAEASANWAAFHVWAKEGIHRQAVLDWIDRLSKGDAPGARTYMECYRAYESTGRCDDWRHAMRALEAALQPHDVWRLPVFAAEVTGDPHGLDRNTLAGKVFYWGLVALAADVDASGHAWASAEPPAAAPTSESVDDPDFTDTASDAASDAPSESMRAVYMKAGIRLDDVSSIVWVGNWAGWFEVPVAIPLMALDRHVKEVPRADAVYVVENPSVFAELLERLPCGVPVVCTSGQPSVAALRLLDMAFAAGSTIYYSGDFDVKGLQMALSLRARYGRAFAAWHMDADTYRWASHDKQPELSEREVQMLNTLHVDWDDELIPAMTRIRKKVFQEQILSRLLGDF